MTSSASPSVIDEQSLVPIAHLNAQEKEYVQPLREYLELNGCRVIINQTPTTGVAYSIASGDYGFVKDIFSTPVPSGVRRLGIVFNSSLSDAENLAGGNTKIVVVDPVYLTEHDVVELFSFFFTGNEIVLDKRRNLHEPVSSTDLQKEKNTQQPGEQLPSLDDIEREIYKQSSKTIDQNNVSKKDRSVITGEGDEKRIGSIVSEVFGSDINKDAAGKKSEEVKKQNVRHHRKKVKTGIGIILTFLFLIFVFPWIWYAVSIGVVGASFAEEASCFKRGDLAAAGRFDAVGTYWLYQGRLAFGLVSFPLRIANFNNTIRGQERLLSFLSDTSSALTETRNVSASVVETAKLILTTNTGNGDLQPASSLEHIRISIESIMESLGLAQAELAALIRDRTFPFYLAPISAYAAKEETTLTSANEILTYIDNLLTLYPQLAGFREPKRYLILLQNSNELRTTGGFIGSVGLAKFQDGLLSDFSIQDVYAVDGQLKGHVDPPAPIRELLAQEHWYLRDSNWDPDFKESGERAAWFYEKETGTIVDGVIAINLPVVIDLLKVTGPIFLPDYNDRISADNFFGKSIYYTQNNSFAGSTQKSDFLGTLARAIVTDVTTDATISPFNLFRAFARGLAGRDILFTFTDTNIQQLVEHFGWAGRVFDTDTCRSEITQSCLLDPIGVFEENVSVNKVNYFIQRTTKRDVIISPNGNISETFTLNIKNTSNQPAQDSVNGVGGVYTTYLRLFTRDITVGNVTLDDTPVPTRNTKSNKPPTIPYVEVASSSAAMKGLGVAVSFAPGSEHAITFTLNHVTPIPFNDGVGLLDLVYYKHPGVSNEVNQTIIHFPSAWKVDNEILPGEHITGFLMPQSNTDSFIAKEGQLEYNSTILQDQYIHLRITQ